MTNQYKYWYELWNGQVPAESALTRLNIDAGNWDIKQYIAHEQSFKSGPSPLAGYFLPGNLAMAAYHPRSPLLGQMCPGTPIILIGNFNFGTVSLYQMSPQGRLVNYGVPFGIQGAGDGCLKGPQGIAVSDDGEVYIVDALNNRISQWQFLQTGQVVFIRNFVWQDAQVNTPPKPFTPTDIAIDGNHRLFVTDQFNNRICVFDRRGESLWCQGREGYWEEGQGEGDKFMLPTSLAIEGDHLIVNDLVNRALKLFRIGPNALQFEGGISLFKLPVEQGGVWMPFFMHAEDRQVFIADSTYNIVQVFSYQA